MLPTNPICSVVLVHYGVVPIPGSNLAALLADPQGQTRYSIQDNSTPSTPVIQTRPTSTAPGQFESFNVEGALASIHSTPPAGSGKPDAGVLTFAIKSAVGLA